MNYIYLRMVRNKYFYLFYQMEDFILMTSLNYRLSMKDINKSLLYAKKRVR